MAPKGNVVRNGGAQRQRTMVALFDPFKDDVCEMYRTCFRVLKLTHGIFLIQVLGKEWTNQREKLRVAFDRIIQAKNNKAKKGSQSKTFKFYDYENYTTLTNLPTENNARTSLEPVPSTSSDSGFVDIETPINSNVFPTAKRPSRKRSHSENCLVICINCLEKTKKPRKLSDHESISKCLATLYPDFHQDKKYLPEIICQCCFDKLENNSQCTVDYKALIESVKMS